MEMELVKDQGEKSKGLMILQRRNCIPLFLPRVVFFLLLNIIFVGAGSLGLARAQVKNGLQRANNSGDSQESKPDKKTATEKNDNVVVKGVPGFDAQSSRTDILSHLNAVVSLALVQIARCRRIEWSFVIEDRRWAGLEISKSCLQDGTLIAG